MNLAQRLQSIKPSPTLAMTAKAAQMKATGIDVISLSAGEPDFDTPEFIKEAARKALQAGLTKYTAVDGMPALKKAIQEKFQRDTSLTYELDQIIVSSGGKQVIFNALMATLNAGDEVIIPSPYWVSYPDITALFGGIPRTIPCGPETSFKLTPAALKAAITPQTKWLILNSPSNPTGSVYTREELQALAEVLEQAPHVMILCDDIYEYLVYDGTQFVTLAQVTPHLKDRILIVNGVSKSCSMTGWRIGFGAGPAALINAMSMLQSQSTSNACSIAQAAAIVAINGPHDFLDEWKQTFVSRRDLCLEALSHIPGLTYIKPHGAFYLYIGCADLIGKTTPDGQSIQTDDDFCTYLLTSARLAVVSGAGFGLSPYFRISYAASRDVLVQACHRLEEAVRALK